MTNWQKFKIESKNAAKSFDFILFSLDKNVEYSGGKKYGNNHIFCIDTSPFNSWEERDYIEIDLDKVQYYSSEHKFNDDNIVRKFGSSAVVPSSSSTGMTIGSTAITREHGLAIARELDSYVEQSGGRNEYTTGIEVKDDQGKPIRFFISSRRK